ncbi:MAG: DUF1549 domain-containing protein [Planctomycetes bacterium]|nr:DUF1549 domain-containing protein [Planctomycetota bacterium]
MSLRALASFAWLLVATSAWAQEESEEFYYEYDFAWDIAPRLVQAGCATAECHGGATGRGGFKLSLFGTDPRADYDAIVEELDGRRIDRLDPERSLVLRKPTLDLEHGGGLRWNEDDDAVRVLREWIAAGAPFRADDPFVPQRLELERIESGLQRSFGLRVLAIDAQGRAREVGDRATISSSDPDALRVRGGVVTHARAPGWIFARFQQLDARLEVPGGELRELDAARADPLLLARRLCFDLVGRWPTPEELRRYLAWAEGERLGAYARELVDGAEFAAHFARFVDRWLGSSPGALTSEELALAPLDRIAREALRGGGRSALLRRRSDPRDRMEHFAGAFLGLRLECARCHNHPADRWTQRDHLAFSAPFVDPRPDASPGPFFDPASGERIEPRFLGTSASASEAAFAEAALVDWLLSEQRERFAENLANRLAAFLLGAGLVEPLDDHRTTNPPRDLALLRELRERLLAARFEARPVLLWLCATEHYQRPSDPSPEAPTAAEGLRRARVLRPEELLPAIARALDAPPPELQADASPLARELELLHGEPLERVLRAPGNLLEVLAELEPSAERALEELYLALLTRPPREAERALLLPRFASGAVRLEVLREIARALILTREIGAHR